MSSPSGHAPIFCSLPRFPELVEACPSQVGRGAYLPHRLSARGRTSAQNGLPAEPTNLQPQRFLTQNEDTSADPAFASAVFIIKSWRRHLLATSPNPSPVRIAALVGQEDPSRQSELLARTHRAQAACQHRKLRLIEWPVTSAAAYCQKKKKPRTQRPGPRYLARSFGCDSLIMPSALHPRTVAPH
jgi:hypothetical protein